MLRGMAADGTAVLVSSHILAEVAQTADSVVIIDHGRLVAQAPLAGLLGSSHANGSLEEVFFELTRRNDGEGGAPEGADAAAPERSAQ
jgi:ABC-2 type transport system ATP-binding protein